MEQIIEIMTDELAKIGFKMVALALVITLIMMAFTLAKKRILRMVREKKSKSSKFKTINTNTKWKTEWKWDEESQTWVHPQSKKSGPEDNREEIKEDIEETIDFTHAYQAQQIFTRNEWQNYKTLRDVAEVKGYIICPKVRLLDIVKPRTGEKKYKTLLYKIQSKHVDFVICDQNMNIKAIIELDDKTHDTEKGKERDKFVDTVLRSVGYKVIHTRYIDHDILDLV